MKAVLHLARPATVVGALLLLCSTKIVAEDTTNQTQSATTRQREEDKQRRAKLPFTKGTLISLDLLRHELKLKTPDGPRTFTYTFRTYIFRGKEKIAPDKLQVGETIAVRFGSDKDGVVTAQRIKAYGIPQPGSDATTEEIQPPE